MTTPPSTDRRLRTEAELDILRFDASGLLPVVAQDRRSGAVLMVAWANREALALSIESGEAHFWSRSRGRLWRKGESSGHTLAIVSLHADCDGDTVLAIVDPSGPACHTLEATCFGAGASRGLDGEGTATGLGAMADRLWATLRERERNRPEGSYTVRLLEDENLRLKKLGEETVELVTAVAKGGPPERIREEGADLLYHLLVALLGAGVPAEALAAELEKRSG